MKRKKMNWLPKNELVSWHHQGGCQLHALYGGGTAVVWMYTRTSYQAGTRPYLVSADIPEILWHRARA